MDSSDDLEIRLKYCQTGKKKEAGFGVPSDQTSKSSGGRW